MAVVAQAISDFVQDPRATIVVDSLLLASEVTEGTLISQSQANNALEIDSLVANRAIQIGSSTNTDLTLNGATAGRDVTWDASANALIALDNASYIAGTGSDLTISHDATNTNITSATGDLNVLNTAVTGSTVMRLGTATTAVSYEVQDSASLVLHSITGDGAALFVKGLRVLSFQANAITAARVLTVLDSGGVFSVAKTSAYAITLPTAAAGMRFKFMVLDAGAFAVTISDGAAHLIGVVDIVNVLTSTNMTTTATLTATGTVGDWIEFEGIDATHYMVTGACVAAADISFA